MKNEEREMREIIAIIIIGIEFFFFVVEEEEKKANEIWVEERKEREEKLGHVPTANNDDNDKYTKRILIFG